MKQRNYMFTIWVTNPDLPHLDIPVWRNCNAISRVTFQLEKGNKSGKLHWQCFIELKYPLLARVVMGQLGVQAGFDNTFHEKFKNKHRCAGRSYAHKADTCVDEQHRYIWTPDGYLNNKPRQPCWIKAIEKSIIATKCMGQIDRHLDKNNLLFLLDKKLYQVHYSTCHSEGHKCIWPPFEKAVAIYQTIQ